MATSRKITVSTDVVTTVGAKIETDYAVRYKSTSDEMFQKMEALMGTWNGTDFSEYSKRVLSFKDDFAEMYKALLTYADYLKKAAKAYETAQNSVLNDARSTLKM